MRPVKNKESKIKILRPRFWEKLFKHCDKARENTCQPLLMAINNPSLFGFHHMLKDDKGNRENYPDVIDCIFFLEYTANCCHTNCDRFPLKHITPYQAGVRQETLNKPKWKLVKDWVNGIVKYKL
jgi:hypothetical protein